MSKSIQKQTQFIGRNEESKRLLDIYQEVITNKQSQVVLIEGSLGIGKTALVEHFIQEIADPKNDLKKSLIGIGKCTLESQMVGLQPFGQMLSNLGKDKSFEMTIGNVFQFINKVAPAWVDVFTQGAASSTVKALSTSFTSSNESFVQEQKLDINSAYTGFAKILKEISKKNVVVGFIDDFHWADKSSVGLLEYLVDPKNLDGFNESQVMIIVSYRPFEDEEVSPLFRRIINEVKFRPHRKEIKLTEGIPAREYINAFYPNNDFPNLFLNEVEQHSKGNPLLLKQLFSYLELYGDITPKPMPNGNDSWESSPRLASQDFIQQILQQNVIDSIGAVLFERYRLLQDKDSELYETLSFASIEGEYFSVQVIAALREKKEEDIFKSLQKLENKHQMVQYAENRIIDVNGQVLDIYYFTPLILQDIIYKDLAPGQRRNRHRQVAEFLVEKYSNSEKNMSQLAIQFQKAQEPLKAAHYALKAAEYEQSQSKILEAENWCIFGIKLLENLPSSKEAQELRSDFRKTIADGYFYSGEYGKAAEKYNDLLESNDLNIATPEKSAEIFIQAAHACILKGESNEQATNYCRQGKNLLKSIPFNQYYFALEVNYTEAREIDKEIKIELFKSLLEYGETLKDESYRNKHLALGYKWMGNKYLDLGKYEEAKKYYQESKTFSKKCANKDLEAQAILNLADLCWEICDFASSVEYAKEGYTLSEAIKELDNLAYSLAIQGSTYLQQGEYSLALEKLQLAIKDSEKLDSDWNMPFMCADTAICLLELGRNKESLEYAQRAIEYKKDNVKYGYALCALGRVTARLQGNSDAKKYFEESLMKLSEVGHKNFHSQAQYYWAEILLQTQSASDRNEALVLLQDAYVEFKKLGIKHRMDLVKDLMSKQKLDLIL